MGVHEMEIELAKLRQDLAAVRLELDAMRIAGAVGAAAGFRGPLADSVRNETLIAAMDASGGSGGFPPPEDADMPVSVVPSFSVVQDFEDASGFVVYRPEAYCDGVRYVLPDESLSGLEDGSCVWCHVVVPAGGGSVRFSVEQTAGSAAPADPSVQTGDLVHDVLVAEYVGGKGIVQHHTGAVIVSSGRGEGRILYPFETRYSSSRFEIWLPPGGTVRYHGFEAVPQDANGGALTSAGGGWYVVPGAPSGSTGALWLHVYAGNTYKPWDSGRFAARLSWSDSAPTVQSYTCVLTVKICDTEGTAVSRQLVAGAVPVFSEPAPDEKSLAMADTSEGEGTLHLYKFYDSSTTSTTLAADMQAASENAGDHVLVRHVATGQAPVLQYKKIGQLTGGGGSISGSKDLVTAVEYVSFNDGSTTDWRFRITKQPLSVENGALTLGAKTYSYIDTIAHDSAYPSS